MGSVNLKIEPRGEPPLFLELSEGDFLIGRGEDCEVLINHNDVSRKHALLSIGENGLFVEDLGSSNGTFVDGKPANSSTSFTDGQTVVLGDGAIKIEFADSQEELHGVGNFRSRVGGFEQDLSKSNYLFKKEIARGGMGTVLEAEDLNTGRIVAVKKMLQGSAATAEGQFRFQQEARVMGFLEHANIVPMHELGVNEKGIPYYTMKRVRGVTLQQVLSAIKDGDKQMAVMFPLGRLLRIFQKMCDGVAFAHSKGVVHRDLKPENVLVGEFGEVMVMDWGLAKVLNGSPLKNTIIGRMPDILEAVAEKDVGSGEVSESGRFRTRDGQVIGTPNFMPPEQAEGRLSEVDERSDIFSLGGILYSILTLRSPVTGDTVEEVLANMRSGYIPPPVIYNKVKASRLLGMGRGDDRVVQLIHCPNQEIPEPLSRVAMQAMALNAQERYGSIRELQLEVEAWQSGRVTRAEEAGFGRQLLLFLARHKPVAIAAAVVLFMGLMFLGQSFQAEQKAQQALDQLAAGIPFMEAEAKQQITAGKFDRAERHLETLISFLPKAAKYHVLLGNVRQSDLRFTPAIKAYETALKLGADGQLMVKEIAICRELDGMMTDDGLSSEGISKLVDHLNSERRYAEATQLAVASEVEIGVSSEAVEGIRQTLREQEAPEEVLQRVAIDEQNRYVLNLERLDIADIEWAAGIPFRVVNLAYTDVSDLRPLSGMPLEELNLTETPIVDLKPIREAAINDLRIAGTQVSDLSVVVRMPLEHLDIAGTEIKDLSFLPEEAKLRSLSIEDTQISDLTPLKGRPLKELRANRSLVSDLEPLREMKLETLEISDTDVRDLGPLKYAELRFVKMSSIPASDFRILRDMPLKVGWFNDTQLADLSVFAGKPINELHLARVPANDFSALRGLPLTRLTLAGTTIEDLSPLNSKDRLVYLDVSFTRVQKLAPLRTVRLQALLLHGCPFITDWETLLRMPGLDRLSVSGGTRAPDLERWKKGRDSRHLLSLNERSLARLNTVEEANWRDERTQKKFWSRKN